MNKDYWGLEILARAIIVIVVVAIVGFALSFMAIGANTYFKGLKFYDPATYKVVFKEYSYYDPERSKVVHNDNICVSAVECPGFSYFTFERIKKQCKEHGQELRFLPENLCQTLDE